MRNDFSCQEEYLRQFSKETLPTRNHFTNNIRIGDVILDTYPGYTSDMYSDSETPFFLGGTHGWDNLFVRMQVSE